MSKLPIPLQKLMIQLRKLPGVGAKTAERYAFELLSWEPHALKLLAQSLDLIQEELKTCPCCGSLQAELSCELCDPTKRDPSLLCVVAFPKEIYPIEEARIFKGMYHVLGGVLSPNSGYTTAQIDLSHLEKRLHDHQVTDLILALDATLEGDATAFFLKESLSHLGVKISRLAFGIPLGSPLEYVDPGTLSRAFAGRHLF